MDRSSDMSGHVRVCLLTFNQRVVGSIPPRSPLAPDQVEYRQLTLGFNRYARARIEHCLSAAATVLRVGECPRIEGAQVCCCVDFSSIIPCRAIAGYEHKANENVVASLGIHDGRNSIVTHLTAPVLVEHGNAGAKISIAFETTANFCNDASPAGQNMQGKPIIRRHLGLRRRRAKQKNNRS
jgi:hypothetical protein